MPQNGITPSMSRDAGQEVRALTEAGFGFVILAAVRTRDGGEGAKGVKEQSSSSPAAAYCCLLFLPRHASRQGQDNRDSDGPQSKDCTDIIVN